MGCMNLRNILMLTPDYFIHSFIHYFILFIILKGGIIGRQVRREEEVTSVCWFTPKVVSVAWAGPG